MTDATLRLPDGRELSYVDAGAADGDALFFFHGAPMSRLHLAPLAERFAAHGLRLIAADRPGYGGSSPQRNRTMGDWADDVAALAGALDLERFLVAGHSSGGPYAVACCALLPGRVTGGVILAGVTEMTWPGAWDGFLESEAELMRAPDESATLASCIERFGRDGSGFFAAPFDLPEPDVAMLSNAAADAALTAALGEAFRQGVVGYAQDVFVQARPWPFDPTAISVPVEVAHGDLDTLVPIAHSRHTAGRIPSARLRILPRHGHLTIVTELPGIASGLRASAA